MSGKPRRHAKKHSSQSKKRKSGRSPQSTVARRQANSQITVRAVPAAKTASPITSTPVAAAASDRYSYIFPELKRVGIIAGIIMVILIVLALVLP